MATKTITSANAVILLSIAGLYPIAQRLQGFAADDIFDTDAIEPAEIQMGVDARMSAGYVPRETPWNISLQADSASNQVFEDWLAAMKSAQDVLYATGTVNLPSVGRTYAMTKGVLTSIPQISGAKKVLQPRRYRVTWEDVSPASI